MVVGKATWDPLELTLTRKIVNQSNIAFVKGLQSFVPVSRMQVWQSHDIPIQLTYLVYAEDRWILDHNSRFVSFNQVVTNCGCYTSYGFKLLEQIKTPPDVRYAAIDLANAFFSVPVRRNQQKPPFMNWMLSDPPSHEVNMYSTPPTNRNGMYVVCFKCTETHFYLRIWSILVNGP